MTGGFLMDIDKNKMQSILKMKGKTYSQLSKDIGVTRMTLYRWVRYGIKEKDLIALIAILKINRGELLK